MACKLERTLGSLLHVHIVTANIYGSAPTLEEEGGILVVGCGDQAEANPEIIRGLRPRQTVAIANDSIDVVMLREASLDIVVIGR